MRTGIGGPAYLIFSDFFWLFVKLTKVVCIDIALCIMVHDVEISPSLTTNDRWNSQSFEMNDAWKKVNHSFPGITHISDKIFRFSMHVITRTDTTLNLN